MGLKFNRASNGTRHKEGVRRRFTRANVARESNKGGVYHFYDENGRRIYTVFQKEILVHSGVKRLINGTGMVCDTDCRQNYNVKTSRSTQQSAHYDQTYTPIA